jgi:hypothetical protein
LHPAVDVVATCLVSRIGHLAASKALWLGFIFYFPVLRCVPRRNLIQEKRLRERHERKIRIINSLVMLYLAVPFF